MRKIHIVLNVKARESVMPTPPQLSPDAIGASEERRREIGTRRSGTRSRTQGRIPAQQWSWKLMVVVLAAPVAALIAWNIIVRLG